MTSTEMVPYSYAFRMNSEDRSLNRRMNSNGSVAEDGLLLVVCKVLETETISEGLDMIVCVEG